MNTPYKVLVYRKIKAVEGSPLDVHEVDSFTASDLRDAAEKSLAYSRDSNCDDTLIDLSLVFHVWKGDRLALVGEPHNRTTLRWIV